uniref:Uncharacterized protein n=1 Tax=Lepeophtheirus salmonis TaxID=72036 RepID=A0A0K2V5A0_LEPSM
MKHYYYMIDKLLQRITPNLNMSLLPYCLNNVHVVLANSTHYHLQIHVDGSIGIYLQEMQDGFHSEELEKHAGPSGGYYYLFPSCILSTKFF